MGALKEILGVAVFLLGMIWLCMISPVPKAEIPREVYEPIVMEVATTVAPLVETQEAVEMPPVASSVCERFSDEDKDLLVRVAFCEAGNQGWEGMAAVMNVIINRSNLYGVSIREVVYAPEQFAVVNIIYEREPSEAAYTALWAVEQGWDVSQGALYFCSPAHNGWHSSHLTYLFTGWGHEFYK